MIYVAFLAMTVPIGASFRGGPTWLWVQIKATADAAISFSIPLTIVGLPRNASRLDLHQDLCRVPRNDGTIGASLREGETDLPVSEACVADEAISSLSVPLTIVGLPRNASRPDLHYDLCSVPRNDVSRCGNLIMR